MAVHHFGNFHIDIVLSQDCNPSPSLSCGACCGLYDFQDISRQHLEYILYSRAGCYRRFLADIDLESPDSNDLSIRMRDAAKALTDICKDQAIKPGTEEPCVFLGFTKLSPQTVGCLLHPSQNQGLDLRYFGKFSQPLCASYSCCHPEARTLAELCRDWYDYGLKMSILESALPQRSINCR